MRGDSASEYLVMVLDASQNYVWSTHGNGNVMLEVGGDSRTAGERADYNRVYAAEFWGKALSAERYYEARATDTVRFGRRGFSGDSLASDRYTYFYSVVGAADSAGRSPRRYYNVRGDTTSAITASGQRWSVFRSQAPRDTVGGFGRSVTMMVDSTTATNVDFSFTSNGVCGSGTRARSGRGGGNTAEAAPLTYPNGWVSSRYPVSCNQATGLQDRRPGESGIVGLPAANVAAADIYMFAPGELAPRELKVLVAHLTSGTVWSGR